jgi:opacity protein-like surface antigen
MRPIAHGVSILCASLALFSAPAAAQREAALESSHLVRVGIGGGMSVPTGDFKDAFDNGYNAQAFLMIKPPGLPLSFRVTGTFNRFDLKDVQVAGVESGYSQVAGGLANVTLHLLHGPVSPYIMAGLGALNFKTYLDTSSGDQDVSDTKFGVDGGAGIAIKLGRLDAFVEGRIANVYTDKGVVDTKSIKYVPVTFGVIF